MNHHDPHLSVELLGLPGAGKSTVERLLIRELRRSMAVYGEDALTRQALVRHIRGRRQGRLKVGMFLAGRLLLRNVYSVTKYEIGAFNRFNLEHPTLTGLIMEAASHDAVPLSRKEKICKLWFKFTSAWQLAREFGPPREASIWSEGFVQRGLSAVSLCPPETAEPLLESYAHTIPRPSCLIHVAVSPENLTTRMKQRARGLPEPLRSMNDGERSAYLQQLQTYLQHLLHQLGPAVHTITIENDSPDGPDVSNLHEELTELHGGMAR